MNESRARQWNEANHRHLMAAVTCARARIEARLKPGSDPETDSCLAEAQRSLAAIQAALPAPSAIDLIARRFGLSEFERELLVLCAGVELDPACAAACAQANGDPRAGHVTFSLGLAALPGAHWSALTPAAPLRRWKLLELGAGSGLTSSPLRIDERVLHALAGVNYVDERLGAFIQPLANPDSLAPSHQAVADTIASLWEREPAAILLLVGPASATKASIVAAAAGRAGGPVFTLRSADLPSTPAEREILARLWEREAALQGATLLVDAEDGLTAELQHATRGWVGDLHARAAIAVRDAGEGWRRDVHRFEVGQLPTREQHALWQEALGPLRHLLNGEIDSIAGQFSLAPASIRAVATEAHARAEAGDLPRLPGFLWDQCQRLARPRLEDLAERMASAPSWEDLVLPEPQIATLRTMAVQVRERFQVYEKWGFGTRLSRGLGITALFTGASGTGKTLAAEVLAGELHLDLYRIDLSSVVSKYIGETEKNLRRVFDAAETRRGDSPV